MNTQAVVEVLGGPAVLGRGVRKPDDLARLVRNGLPSRAINALAETLNIGTGTLAGKLGIPQRTLTRRLSDDARLNAGESDRAVRMARLFAHGTEMIGDRGKAAQWMATPNRALGGERPIDCLDTDTGARMVEDILGRIGYGVYS